jgi:alkylhydroperoxidase family enzyme
MTPIDKSVLRRAGESNERLDGLAGWRDSPYFSEPEKAALEWAESLTHVDITHAPDAAYEPLKRHYDDVLARSGGIILG